MKTLRLKQLALLIAPLLSSSPLLAANVVEDNTKELAEMTVRHSRPATVVQNPSPQAEVTGEQARNMNVVNTEDIVKYLPSLQIRKRYIGDRNAIIAARTTGTVQSARSLVYADGLLLSNLLGNSFAYPARWNLVGSEEIDAVSADKHRQPTVVTLWSSDCGYCKANLKLLSSLTRNNRKLRVITVAAEPENAHLWPMLSRYGLAGPHYAYGSDSPEAIAYAIDPNWGGELPRTFLFDGAGRKERISGVLTAPAIEKATGLRF